MPGPPQPQYVISIVGYFLARKFSAPFGDAVIVDQSPLVKIGFVDPYVESMVNVPPLRSVCRNMKWG